MVSFFIVKCCSMSGETNVLNFPFFSEISDNVFFVRPKTEKNWNDSQIHKSPNLTEMALLLSIPVSWPLLSIGLNGDLILGL